VACSQPQRLPAWQAECLRNLHQSGAAELQVVIEPVHAEVQPKQLAGSAAFWWLKQLSGRGCRALQLTDTRAAMGGSARVALPEGLAAIRAHSLDFILWLDDRCVPEELFGAARYGVWAFQHGTGGWCGGPPCFQEIGTGNPVTGAGVYRLCGENRCVPLYEGFFPTVPYSWRQHLEQVLFGSAEWPARVCRDIRNRCADYVNSQPRPAMPPAVNPGGLGALRAAARMVLATFRHQLRTLLVREQWHIGVVRAPIQTFLSRGSAPPVEWLPHLPRTRFLADPFAIRRGVELTLLFEDFDHVGNTGRISTAHSSDGGRNFSAAAPVGGALAELTEHASYPCVFTHENEIYCAVETWERNEAALYRARNFPNDWERVCRLLEGPVVDPTLILHDGSWWMFYTRRDRGSNTKLYLAGAPALTGPWKEHPANPVKTDIWSARPGGTPFVHDGVLFRPAQDGSQTYGGSLVIHRVDKLTTTEYEEHPVRRLSPYGGRYARGLHTLSQAGDMTVVDGKRFVLLPEILPGMLREKLRSLWSRLSPRGFQLFRHNNPAS
jgi:hypothetical protein